MDWSDSFGLLIHRSAVEVPQDKCPIPNFYEPSESLLFHSTSLERQATAIIFYQTETLNILIRNILHIKHGQSWDRRLLFNHTKSHTEYQNGCRRSRAADGSMERDLCRSLSGTFCRVLPKPKEGPYPLSRCVGISATIHDSDYGQLHRLTRRIPGRSRLGIVAARWYLF